MNARQLLPRLPLLAGTGLLCFSLAGCSEDKLTSPSAGNSLGMSGAQPDEAAPPAGLVSVGLGSEALEFWPYTGGQGFDGTPSDPLNLVLAGNADPVMIRQALLQLDGDRSAFGIPDVYPFNSVWTDAQGDVQTNWAEGDGWNGSAIQLQLGDYDPARVHLRLFRTGSAFGESGVWTLGAAHFEVLIPGTADHQVLSWNIARDIVTIDLIRTGLLGAAPAPTAPIYATPSFREIPAVIYNLLPDDLIVLTGGPPKPVSGPVPILSDGVANRFLVAGQIPIVAGTTTHTMVLTYNQAVPKPICMDGPLDFVLVQGPVEFTTTTTVDASGALSVEAGYEGTLAVIPLDVTQDPPVPAGAPFTGEVSETQSTYVDASRSQAMSSTKRFALEDGGTEIRIVRLKVGTTGMNSYRVQSKCPAPPL